MIRKEEGECQGTTCNAGKIEPAGDCASDNQEVAGASASDSQEPTGTRAIQEGARSIGNIAGACASDSQEIAGARTIRLAGNLEEGVAESLEKELKHFYGEHPQGVAAFECKDLNMISTTATKVFARLDAASKKFHFQNLAYDCELALKLAGLENHFEPKVELPKLDTSTCSILGEGANGIIYKVNDETIAKVFKNELDFDDCQKERLCLKHALIAGVPAPFSLGYADADGRLAILMELINSESLLAILCDGQRHDELVRQYARMVKDLHSITAADKLSLFERKAFEDEILSRADLIDEFLSDGQKGLARKMIESIDEPESLIHGDIQPGNIMLGDGGLMFIDLDTFSTGRGAFDLGALYRTFFTDTELLGRGQIFMKIPEATCREIWSIFIEEYYGGEPAEFISRKMREIKAIAYVQALGKHLMKNPEAEYAKTGLARFKEFLKSIS